MTEPSASPVFVAIVDRDRIFSLGLQAWIGDQLGADAVTVERFDHVALLLERVQDTESRPVALAIVGEWPSAQRAYQTLGDRGVRVLALVAALTPELRDRLQAIGVRGACSKTTEATQILALVQDILTDRDAWPRSPIALSEPFERTDHLTGMDYMNAAIVRLDRRLEQAELSRLERWFLAGQRREVRAARWMAQRLRWRSRSGDRGDAKDASDPSSTSALTPDRPADRALVRQPAELALTVPADIRALCLDRVRQKLQGETPNQTGRPLEIDILNVDRRRELLTLILEQFEVAIAEAVAAAVSVERLYRNRNRLVADVWSEAALTFFGYYRTAAIDGRTVSIIEAVLESRTVVRRAVLDRIPLVPELLATLVCAAPLVVDNRTYDAGSPEACLRAQMLLENLLVQVANAIVQPLLEQFGDVESVKRDFYDRPLLSTREIERFRNDLSWRFRWQLYVSDPTAIYESRHPLYILGEVGIRCVSVYAPRRHELESLGWLQQTVTLVLESRDALTPRVRQVVSIVGSGLVYVLTQVVGRGLGLIGRGILDGIGQARLDRPSRNRRDSS